MYNSGKKWGQPVKTAEVNLEIMSCGAGRPASQPGGIADILLSAKEWCISQAANLVSS